VHYLDNKVFDITDARCNHEVHVKRTSYELFQYSEHTHNSMEGTDQTVITLKDVYNYPHVICFPTNDAEFYTECLNADNVNTPIKSDRPRMLQHLGRACAPTYKEPRISVCTSCEIKRRLTF